MGRQKKTDKGRLKEGRGTGRGKNYKPWLKVHEFPSNGRVHRPMGWKTKRIHQLMSDLEYYYFLIIQWQETVLDIREQYPLLPLEQTIHIAQDLGIPHPSDPWGKPVVMTTDFLITVKKDNLVYDMARTIKPLVQLEEKRVREKFLIEKAYWKLKDMDWGIVTDQEIPKTRAQNIAFLYDDYFWGEERKLSKPYINQLKDTLLLNLARNDFDIMKTLEDFDIILDWASGETLGFLKYLLVRKIIHTDFDKKLNFHTMKIWQ